MSEIPTLKRLERRDNDMLLSWDDGTEHTITYNDLRYYCPCAKCGPLRNEDETALSLRRQVESQENEKPTVRTTGNYALIFEWSDGCSSGIFRFERIWSIGESNDPDGGRTYVHGAW